jgi:hypothetical protein
MYWRYFHFPKEGFDDFRALVLAVEAAGHKVMYPDEAREAAAGGCQVATLLQYTSEPVRTILRVLLSLKQRQEAGCRVFTVAQRK